MTIRLVPLHVFKAEITRLNELYWSTRYSYNRVADLLKSLNKSYDDPRVNALLPSDDVGETTHIIRPLSDFLSQLKKNESDLRTTAILHMCSAFETALSNYFAICAIYMPQCIDKKYSGKHIPDIFQDPDNYEALKKWAIKVAGEKLHGLYTKRLDTFINIFGCDRLPTDVTQNIDEHYKRRHLIAHDQSLIAADAPDLGVAEILQSQIIINEDVWKMMIRDFQMVIEGLDIIIQKSVVTDKGLRIAIYHIVAQSGKINIGKLRYRLESEWKIGKPDNGNLSIELTRKICEQMGFITQLVKGKYYEICSKPDHLTSPSIEMVQTWQSSHIYSEIDWNAPRETRQKLGFWFVTTFNNSDDLNLYLNSDYIFFKKHISLNKILIADKRYNELTAEWIIGGDVPLVAAYVRHMKQLNFENKFAMFSYKRLGT